MKLAGFSEAMPAGVRFDVGHHSELKPASFRTIPGRVTGASGGFRQVSASGISALVITHEERLMPAKRELTMRQIRQLFRLAHDGVSAREIGRMLGAARSTIQDNLKRATAAGLSWPVPGELTDAALQDRLFSHAGVKQGIRRRPEADWAALVCELKRPGVNLQLLWEEYRGQFPDGYGYSRFCDLFCEFEKRLSPVMRQGHAAGDKVFVDYSAKNSASLSAIQAWCAKLKSSSPRSVLPASLRTPFKTLVR